MKTKAERKDIRGKDEAALVTLVSETREAMRLGRFGKAGAPGVAGQNARAQRKLIARAETELTARRLKTKTS